MPDQDILKPIVIDRHYGMFTSLPSYLIPDGYVANSLNIQSQNIGYITPWKLYTELLSHTVTGKFISGVNFKKSDGTILPMLLLDTGTVCKLYWYNAASTRLELLLDNLTTGKRMAWSGEGYNTNTTDGIFFCNGVQNYSFWNGATTVLTSAVSANDIEINVSDTTNFSTKGTIIYNGTEVNYGSKTATKLKGATITGTGIAFVDSNPDTITDTGNGFVTAGFQAGDKIVVSGTTNNNTTFTVATVAAGTLTLIPGDTVTAEAAGASVTITGYFHASAGADDGVAEAVDDSTYSSAPKFDILTVNDGRVFGSFTDGVRVYFSQVGVGSNFTSDTDPDDPGFFDLIEGGGNVTALGTFKDFVLVCKKDLVKYYQLTYPTSTTRARDTDILRQGTDLGCAGPDAILSVNDRTYYVSPNGGVRWIGESDVRDGLTYGDMTNLIHPTLADGVFDLSKMVYWEKERVMIITYRSDSDASYHDRQVMIEFTESDAIAKVNPIGINDWDIGCFFEYGGDLYFGSNIESKVYKAFDGYSKAGAPALTLVTFKRYAFGNRFTRKGIKYLAVRGRIPSGQLLHFVLSYDRAGALGVLEATMSHDERRYIIATGPSPTIGSEEIGVNVLGGSLDNADELDPFLVIFELPTSYKPYDIELTIYSDGVDADGNLVGNRFSIEDIAFYPLEEPLNVDANRKKPFIDSNINDL